MEEELLARLAELTDAPEREAFFAERTELRSRETLSELCDTLSERLWVDVSEAERLLGTVEWLAAELADDYGRGRYLRARANVEMFRRDHAAALRDYRAALACFEAGGHEFQAARTRFSGTHSLVHLGLFEEALRWIEAARGVFAARDARLYLARLDFNTGTLMARQDRFREALELFEAAQLGFASAGRPFDVAMSLRNIAVCLQDLNRLREAEEAYRRAADYCAEQGLDTIGVEVGCNAAYLHFLRGDYGRAIRDFERARRTSERLGDRQHRALADLDEAEVYLELNLPQEAERLAAEAAAGFEALEMAYEASKATVFRALALSRRGRKGRRRAVELLRAARRAFEALDNRLWPARIDLHQASVLAELGDLEPAWRLAEAALDSLGEVPSLAAVCEILLARLELARGEAGAALRRIDRMSPSLERRALRRLAFQVHLTRAQAHESRGEAAAALAAYGAAERALDELRGQLITDELKTAYLADKQSIYEGLFRLTAYGPAELRSAADAFRFMEKGKSRGLVDLLAPGVQSLPARTARGAELAADLRRLREEVGWLQRQIDRAQAGGGETSAGRVGELQSELRAREGELMAAVRRADLDDQEYSSLQTAASPDPAALQASLPAETTLIEYFIAGGSLSAAVVRRDRLEIVPLGDAAELERAHDSFRFQIGKYVRGDRLPAELRALAGEAMESRMRALYGRLLEPLEELLDGSHVVLVPHGFLHWLPLHALDGGSGCLMDRFTISYAPSAQVFQLCAERPSAACGPPLVLGVADEKAPLIEQEARAVAEALPGSVLLLGEEASVESLRRLGEEARFVHVATHGFFRGDHPMFSAIRLGDGRLSVLDVYRLSLGAELVVLSGCSTGLNVVRGGDEQVGLTRGLLYAGARALMVSLWDVDDASTEALMRLLYARLAVGESPAEALAAATRELRESYPEPYYWAPFVLTGWPFPEENNPMPISADPGRDTN